MALLLISPVNAQAPLEAPQALPRLITIEQVESLVSQSAERYGANKGQILKVIECESPKTIVDGVVYYDTQGQSRLKYRDGTQENSWGLAQIHLSAHPDISKEQATDPVWALDWVAKEFSEEREWQWTCWRILYGT